jgi:hypothetical protein
MLPRTIDGMEHVCHFRHALALDERRVKFLPEYAHGVGTAKPENKGVSTISNGLNYINVLSPKNEDPPIVNHRSLDKNLPTKDQDAANHQQVRTVLKCPHTLEVWFAGTHSDM